MISCNCFFKTFINYPAYESNIYAAHMHKSLKHEKRKSGLPNNVRIAKKWQETEFFCIQIDKFII